MLVEGRCGAAAVMVGAVGARADFVVDNGETVVVTQLLFNGDTGLVKPGGRILTNGLPGVVAFFDNTLTNEGRITTVGVADVGVFVVDNNIVNNTGTISTLGTGSAFGIAAVTGNTIGNSGTISTQGGTAHGILAGSGNTDRQFRLHLDGWRGC